MPVGISDVKSHFFNSAGTESADTKVEVFSNGMPFWLRRIMASSYGVSAAGESIFEVWDWDPVAGSGNELINFSTTSWGWGNIMITIPDDSYIRFENDLYVVGSLQATMRTLRLTVLYT